MAEEAGGELYSVDALRAFTERAFRTVGVPDEDAAMRAQDTDPRPRRQPTGKSVVRRTAARPSVRRGGATPSRVC